jgi:putative ABC transport system substrate-binding protein
MKNRHMFIAIVMAIIAAIPLPCHAAGTIIAAMMSSDQPRYREAHRAFVKSLTARGYTTSNTEIILQSPNPDPISWSNTIRKFNAYRPDLIVAYGAPAAQAAMKESEGIPVVAADTYAAEKPVRGACGVSSRVPMVTLLKTLKDIRPFHRIGVLYNAREIGSQRQLDDVKKYAAQLDMVVEGVNVASAPAVDTALNSMIGKVDVIVATESGIVCRQFDRIIARSKARNTPVVSTMPDAAEKGALASLEINPQEQGHLAAEIATRILEGAKSEHLSMLTPRRVDLVINLRAAREMGITIPFPVLGSATRILK